MPYKERLREEALKRARPGVLITCLVAHDDDCPALRGEGDCECDPDFYFEEHKLNGGQDPSKN